MDANAKIRLQIYEHMTKKEVSQVDIAKQLGITPQSVSQVLRGERSSIRSPLLAILDVLGLELIVVPKSTVNENT